jgi:hypothetical protein
MFGKLFGRKPAQSSKPTDPVLSMVLFVQPPSPMGGEFGEAIARAATALQPALPVTFRPGESDADPLTFQGGDAYVMMMVMPGPVPGDDIESALESSPFWPSDETTAFHEAHVVLMAVSDEGEPVAAKLASRIALAMLEQPGAVAWYVGGGMLLHKASFVREVLVEAIAEGSFPTPLWVNLMMDEAAPGMLNGGTVGMDELGQREFEVIRTSRDREELAGILLDCATYTLINGPVLMHGQTFGRTEDERWKIEVGPSKLGRKQTVTRLKMP